MLSHDMNELVDASTRKLSLHDINLIKSILASGKQFFSLYNEFEILHLNLSMPFIHSYQACIQILLYLMNSTMCAERAIKCFTPDGR